MLSFLPRGASRARGFEVLVEPEMMLVGVKPTQGAEKPEATAAGNANARAADCAASWLHPIEILLGEGLGE